MLFTEGAAAAPESVSVEVCSEPLVIGLISPSLILRYVFGKPTMEITILNQTRALESSHYHDAIEWNYMNHYDSSTLKIKRVQCSNSADNTVSVIKNSIKKTI